MSERIVIVDDDLEMCKMLEQYLTGRGFEICWFNNADTVLNHIQTTETDALLTDLNLPGIDGIELCRRVVDTRPDIPVVVITAFGNLETSVAAIRAGAYDFVTKPIDLDLLAIALSRALRHRELQEKVAVLSRALHVSGGLDEIIGESQAMQRMFSLLVRVADTESSVLITGESGTGKELVAKILHKRSRRRDLPFVAVNCSALPESLLESELFGYRRGAFTDAKSDRTGLILQAEGGTLFLDEVGDLPLGLQPKLLRVLQEKQVRPIGGGAEAPFDVRIIAATNRDLESAVEQKLFREDLYYRLNVIELSVPPLRLRGTDTLLLARHFFEYFAARDSKQIRGISETAGKKLLEYEWPGNVRELRNAIERAVAITRFDKISADDLPDKIRSYNRSHFVLTGVGTDDLLPLEQVERRYILHVLETTGRNQSQAAHILGLDRKTLYRKLQKYGQNESD